MNILNSDIYNQPCPCGSEENYGNCCFPLHNHDMTALTAETLMRSRFVAYHFELKDYLLETWDSETRPETIDFTPGLKWTSLNINGKKKGRKKDQEGWVTFVASYLLNGHSESMQEKSYFKKNTAGEWRYVDGEIK